MFKAFTKSLNTLNFDLKVKVMSKVEKTFTNDFVDINLQ
jgi:hypothetical protein